MIGLSELARRFTYHPPKPDQINRYQDIREAGRAFATLLDRHCPDSREKSIALTKLDETVMWANASIARNEPASE
jgi:hypothetical protein